MHHAALHNHQTTAMSERRAPTPRVRHPPRQILGRRKRDVLITDLPDDMLVNVIHHALQMNPRLPGEVSRRVCTRFQTIGRVIAQLSRRFHTLLQHAVTGLQLRARAPYHWLNAMLVFSQASLTSLQLHVEHAPPALTIPHASRLCLMLARTHPPLRLLSVTTLAPAPFEHVVAMLRALPALRDIYIEAPRPVDLAAIAHACPALRSLSLGRTAHYREVRETRTQFARLIAGKTGRSLTTLNMPWCCVSRDAFLTLGSNCDRLENFAVELGAMHWICYRAYVAKTPVQVDMIDLAECAREQRSLFRTMLRALGDGRLRTFTMRTLDGIPAADLDLIFERLAGLTELDLSVGCHATPKACSKRSFDKLTTALARSLTSVNIVGLRFDAQQVERFASEFCQLQTLSVWMGRDERPALTVFPKLGDRIRHLSLLCDWDEHMCAAVGKHNTKLQSLFLVTTHLPLDSISSLLTGVRFTLNEFRLFYNWRNLLDGNNHNINNDAGANAVAEANMHAQNEHEHEPQQQQAVHQNRKQTNGIVYDAARLVAKGCAANLEVLNVSGVSSGHSFVDCTTIAAELRRSAPHLYQICDSFVTD